MNVVVLTGLFIPVQVLRATEPRAGSKEDLVEVEGLWSLFYVGQADSETISFGGGEHCSSAVAWKGTITHSSSLYVQQALNTITAGNV